jgi:hypothetical protein
VFKGSRSAIGVMICLLGRAIKDAVYGLLKWLEPRGELIPLPPEIAKRFGDDPSNNNPSFIGGVACAMILFEFTELPTPKNAREYAILASLKAARRNMRPRQHQQWPSESGTTIKKEEKGQ